MRKGECRYFTGVLHDKCEAGIAYKNVGFVGRKLCCLAGQPSPCGHYSEPTAEEISEYDADEVRFIKESIAQMVILEPTLAKIRKKYKGQNMVGRMNCPVCGSKDKSLTISHAAYNGHLSVLCTTENCVRFME